ncbi:uncharacterized protein LOC107273131 isoform X2 [Cephus cinctus]|uniref:Uncharacterized protein LOC107273131 isoform X2 n=1 Tax=Cephus cinctus TaxID=211228 RepID=A0AAJ7W6E9_CEPCN|nr:uncharacterized protein LOC107273131 isoform X2 [Cephus cinctus]XP_024946116.1 uncharacterized protein LOC107273131 isoform X2 [Cephus cinctus]
MTLMRDRRNSTPIVVQRQQNKGFLGAAYCRGACGVLSASTEDQSEMRIYTDRKNEMDAVNFEVSDVANFAKIIKNTIYSKTDDTSKVFSKFLYEHLARSRQKRMPPETYQSSSEVSDMITSLVHPSDDDDEIESPTFQSKDLVPPILNNTCNETNSNNTSLSPTSLERSSSPKNVSNTASKTNLPKEMETRLILTERNNSFTNSSKLDEETSTAIAMTTNEIVNSATTIKDISNTQGTSNNHNDLGNVSGSTEQLNTESPYISSTTTALTESSEIIQVIPINSSTTETTQNENTDTSKKSITKAEIKKENEAKEAGMSSGIIVLVTGITFSIAVVMAYVGLIVWRRYLDYRYGNRELLVNDLEFDTNDLHHFEL